MATGKRSGWGPGMLVAAAFIGPGTVTAASQAGAMYGYQLAWAIVFSVIATIVLQEMAARLGLIGRIGLGEAIRNNFSQPSLRWAAIGLIVVAIGFGNAAYQTGNLTGASEGLQLLTGLGSTTWDVGLAILAAVALWFGGYGWIERGLITLVIAMSLVFVIAAVLSRPDAAALLESSVFPRVPVGGLNAVIALFGTTIVPYNLFLHASTVQQHWKDEPNRNLALGQARLDTAMAVTVGGVITLAIMATAAATFPEHHQLSGTAEMTLQLEPAVGRGASVLFALGLFAAGLTSSITAPLAAGYAVCGVLGWKSDLKSTHFRAVWGLVLVSGVAVAVSLDKSPLQTIQAAQIANGLVLPLIAVFLLIVLNRADLLGEHRNRFLGNLISGFVVLVIIAFASWKLWDVSKAILASVSSPKETSSTFAEPAESIRENTSASSVNEKAEPAMDSANQ